MTTQPHGEATTNQGSESSIGLSFSGGGFRAAAYSLGSMALLQDLGLMGRARVLSGVSGGSVAIGAYLCCKAGSDAKTETDFHFYKSFYRPFLDYLNTEKLATSFVSLPKLLSGRKLLHAAADNLNAFLEDQLTGSNSISQDPALFSNKKIARMLNQTQLSPDYVFFNTTNITTLDLFRFGLQRSDSGSGSRMNNGASATGDRGASGNPVTSTSTYFLNRYYLKAKPHETSAKLHRHAGQIRIADCVASSFAFPMGFEPMIFPDDFFRPENRSWAWRLRAALPSQDAQAERGGDRPPWQEAKAAFAMTPICDHKPYVAFLDGGLYDNLGLASVEDIRRLINTRDCRPNADADASGNTTDACRSATEGSPGQLPAGIRYVIATDVDNIQPGNANYRDPDLDAALAHAPSAATCQQQDCLYWPPRRLRRWLGLGALVLGVAVLVVYRQVVMAGLSALAAGLAGWLTSWHVALSGAPLPAIAAASVIALVPLLLVALLALLAWSSLQRGLRTLGRPRTSSGVPGPSLAQSLGLGRQFQHDNAAIDPGATLGSLASGLLLGGDPARRLSALRSAIVWRRLNQLLPAFSGYLKRTRALTYAYLEKTYQHPGTAQQATDTPASTDTGCALIRNMIFELSPGPDVDPDPDASLITVRAIDYADARDESAQGPNWATSRKLRRATNLARWMTAQDAKPQEAVIGKHAEWVRSVVTALRLNHWVPASAWTTTFKPGEVDSINRWLAQRCDLQLQNVAAIWLWLDQQLGFDHRAEGQSRPLPKPEPADNADRGRPAECKEHQGNTNSASRQAVPDSQGPAIQAPTQGGERGERKPQFQSCVDETKTIDTLVQNVQNELHEAMARASRQQPGLEQRLRERGRIELDSTAGDASWIPLICEMATNLSTTLWTAGFRWYVFSAPEQAGDRQPGGWYSYPPDASIRAGRLWLDFGPGTTMANQVTVLAGYLCMAFNLLEFGYTSLAAAEETRQDRA